MTARFAAAAALVFAISSATLTTNNANALPLPPEIFVDFSVSYFAQIPGNPVVPAPPEIFPSDMTGIARFFNLVGSETLVLNVTEGAFDIGSLSQGDTFHKIFIPTDPCFGGTSCSFNFSFSGHAGNFAAEAFGATDTIPTDGSTPAPPEIKIDLSSLLIPSPPEIRVSGFIVAFDDPITVGEWDITISTQAPVGVPGPVAGAGLPGLLAGLGAMIAWYRRRRGVAV